MSEGTRDSSPSYAPWRRAAAALVCVAAVAGCDAGSATTAPPQGPAVALRRVAVRDLACTDPCGLMLTYEARRVDTDEPVAATLRLSGDGWFPARVTTGMPEGQATFYWEFPRPKVSGTSYRLAICPEVGECARATATIHLPDE